MSKTAKQEETVPPGFERMPPGEYFKCRFRAEFKEVPTIDMVKRPDGIWIRGIFRGRVSEAPIASFVPWGGLPWIEEQILAQLFNDAMARRAGVDLNAYPKHDGLAGPIDPIRSAFEFLNGVSGLSTMALVALGEAGAYSQPRVRMAMESGQLAALHISTKRHIRRVFMLGEQTA